MEIWGEQKKETACDEKSERGNSVGREDTQIINTGWQCACTTVTVMSRVAVTSCADLTWLGFLHTFKFSWAFKFFTSGNGLLVYKWSSFAAVSRKYSSPPHNTKEFLKAVVHNQVVITFFFWALERLSNICYILASLLFWALDRLPNICYTFASVVI